MNGNGHDQKLKWGMTQKLPPASQAGSLDLENVHELFVGVSMTQKVNKVSGKGFGEVIMAR
jgi:hypothetical protein